MQYIIAPWEHQKKSIEIAINKRDFAFLFEAGTGKTGALINVLRYRFAVEKRVMRTLILCPVVVVENWKNEFKKHSKCEKNVVLLKGSAKKRIELFESSPPESIFITNYEALQMKDLHKKFLTWCPEIIVADESHRLKNSKANRTKLAWSLADVAKHRYILSGTPILNNPMDIWAQFRFLDLGQSFDKNFFVFRARYFVDKNAGMPSQKYFPNWKPRPGVAEEFSKKIYAKAMKADKSECLDLPPLVKTEIPVDMSSEQSRMYQSMKSHFIAYLKDKACVAQIALTRGLRLQQIVSGFFVSDDGSVHSYEDLPRLDALEDLLKDIVDDHKVIIWAAFRENYAQIATRLSKMGIPSVQLVGGMTDKARSEAVDSFQNSPSVRVMIGAPGAGGIGINLTSASYMIYFSRSFNLEHDIQSEARNYRGGSEVHQKITRIDLVTPSTIDDLILQALYRKSNIAEEILSWGGKV
jgi:SWI/SNF-related matrix-associated actin-dependent regulator of chromatin subfamily A-like protein 1